MERQGWLNEYQYQSSVTYDRIKGYSNGQVQQSQYPVRAKISPSATNLCGVLAEIISSPSSSPVRFTIGGIIMIDNLPHALTVQHMLQGSVEQPLSDGQGSIDEDEDDPSPFITSYSTETTLPNSVRASYNQEQLHPHQQGVIPSRNPIDSHVTEKPDLSIGIADADDWPVIGELSTKLHAYNTITSNNPFKTSNHKLDWSLVDISMPGTGTDYPWINRAGSSSWTINSVASVSHVGDCDVWIIAGVSGVLRGCMTGSPATICSPAGTYDVRIVMPERRLGESCHNPHISRSNPSYCF